MSRDDRDELRDLVGHLRNEVRRDERLGRRFVAADGLGAPPEAPAASRRPAAAAPRRGGRAKAASAPGTSSPPVKPAAPKAAVASTASKAPPAAGFAQAATAGPAAEKKPAAKSLPPVGFPKNDERDLKVLAAELAAFGKEASECRKCGLCETRTKVVYGSGTARQPLLFVGEAPGFNEDQQGLPFVGRAGKLLTDIITAMGFERDHVYIANLLKCRPPENRDPLPDEIDACRPWLERQIAIIRPRVICTLGKYSAQLLSGNPKATIGVLRGRIHKYNGVPVVPTYHPAYLLRSPSNKRATWEDVQLVREIYLAADGDPGVEA